MECLTSTKSGAEILLEYGSGTLKPEVAAEVERHIENCEGCRRLTQAQGEVWETLGRWTPPAISQDFNARLYARIAAEHQAPRWRQWLNRVTRPAVPITLWKPAALATACALVLVGFLALDPNASEHNAQPAGVSAGASMESGRVDIDQVANQLDELDVLMPAGSSPSAM
jgi:anti-sigma-K factor RskA